MNSHKGKEQIVDAGHDSYVPQLAAARLAWYLSNTNSNVFAAAPLLRQRNSRQQFSFIIAEMNRSETRVVPCRETLLILRWWPWRLRGQSVL
jgi:hypothetical protein